MLAKAGMTATGKTASSRTHNLCLLTALVIAIALIPAAAAHADAEPNNAIWQAEGPISGGQTVAGVMSAGDIADWYLFYVRGRQQVHLTSTATKSTYGEHDDCAVVELSTGQKWLANDYTTPNAGLNILYVKVFADRRIYCPGYDYSFQMSPASVFASGPTSLTPVDTGEPNETPKQAKGPITGTTLYRGSIDTANDFDYFYFKTPRGNHQVTLTTYTGPQPTGYPFLLGDVGDSGIDRTPVCGPTPRFSITGPGAPDVSAEPGNAYGRDEDNNDNTNASTSSFTAHGAHKYYVGVTSYAYTAPCNQWLFRIDPAGSVSSSTNSKAACTRARKKAAKLRTKIRKTRSSIRRARGAKKKALRRKLVSQRRSLARAKVVVKSTC